MDEALRLSGHREPLGLRVTNAGRLAASPELPVRDLEFSSRGDRVTAHLVRPAEGAGPFPLVLLQAPSSLTARDALTGVAGPWVESGAAVAAIDLPLHGSRADHKLLALLPAENDQAPPWRCELAREFVRQSVIDLERSLDALCALEWIDADRVAFVGAGLGARIGSAFCALDARVRAAAFALHPDGPATPDADPDAWLDRIAPRPVLRLESPAGSSDEPFPAASRNALADFLADCFGAA